MLSKTRKELKKNELDVAFFMAVKNVFYRRTMLFMIIGIIGLGYLSTMFSSAIILGLKFTIEEKVISGVLGHVVIQPEQDKDYLTSVNEIEKKILAIPNVVSVSPRLDSYITLIDKHGSKVTVPVRIIDTNKEYYTTNLHNIIMEGSYLSDSPASEILLGAENTERFRMVQGSDFIDVKSGDMVDSVMDFNGRQLIMKMKIKGIYGQEFMFTDSYAYISDKAVKSLFNISQDFNVASIVVVKAIGRGYEDQIVSDIKSLGISGRIWKWIEKLGMLNQFIDSLMIISNLTAVIGVIIAFATIYIMIFINVLQKRTQIGMMKAMGITEDTILISYIMQSLIYGILGTIFGIILTKGVLGYIYLNPIHMPMGYVRPVTENLTYLKSAVFLLLSAIVAGYMASGGVIKERILDAIFKG